MMHCAIAVRRLRHRAVRLGHGLLAFHSARLAGIELAYCASAQWSAACAANEGVAHRDNDVYLDMTTFMSGTRLFFCLITWDVR